MNFKKDNSQTQVIVLMFGIPGSGKTSFAKELESKLHWQRINRVSLRHELFGSTAFKQKVSDQAYLKTVLEARFKKVLASGQSFICDYKHNYRSERDYVYTLAQNKQALVVLVWLKTPVSTAILRGASRPNDHDSVQSSHCHMRQIIDNNLKQWDVPSASEPLIKLNGLLSLNEQLSCFYQFCQQKFGLTLPPFDS